MNKTLLSVLLGSLISLGSNAQTILSHSTQYNIQGGNSVACGTSVNVSDNYLIRKYDLNDFPAIQDTAFIIQIDAGVESTTGGPYQVRGAVYELLGPLSFSNMSLIVQDTVDVYPDSAQYMLQVPLYSEYALPGQTVVTEIYTPASTDSILFYIGSNFYFENDSSYIAAPSCGIPEPITFATVGYPGTHIILDLWVNQKPMFNDFSVTGLKDYDLTFTKTDFTANFSDHDSDTLTGMVVHTLPAYGDLYLYSNMVNLYDTLWSTDLDSLIYTPDAGYYGTDVFAVQARDNYHSSNSLNIVTIDLMNWVTGLEENEIPTVEVYPNPANDVLNLKLDQPADQVFVIDMEGKVVVQPKANTLHVNVADLPSGTYIIQVVSEGESLYSRFIKE